MSDQQENMDLNPGFVSAGEEVRQELPGALLAAQRQAKGWSVEHVASQLKFAARQVMALEADNYDALPGPVIVRGFVRAYAKLLGMDANALVATLPQANAAPGEQRIVPQRTLSTPFSESPLPLGNRKKLSPLWIGGAVVVLVVAAAGGILHNTDWVKKVPQLAWFKHGSASVTPEDASAQAPADQPELPPEVQESADHGKPEKNDAATDAVASAGNPAITTVSDSATSSDVAPAAVATPPIEQAAVPAAVQPAVQVASVNSTSPVTGNLNVSKSKDLLRLNFREDSWVEIRRNDNSIIISRLLKAGTTEAFDITEPVTLVIGNVAGVDASLRGAKLDLQTSNNSNVARLSLK